MTAEDRREQVIDASIGVFARRGFEGATTAEIAAKVGVSQPYLFRLFPTKKDLFLAASERNMDDTIGLLRASAGGKTGHEAMYEMAEAYQQMLDSNRDWLLMMLQSFAACHDAGIQRQTRDCLQKIWRTVETLTGLPAVDRMLFFAKGFLCNVMAAATPPGEDDPGRAEITAAMKEHAETILGMGIYSPAPQSQAAEPVNVQSA
jgi:AcrR family transcriptional regulator